MISVTLLGFAFASAVQGETGVCIPDFGRVRGERRARPGSCAERIGFHCFFRWLQIIVNSEVIVHNPSTYPATARKDGWSHRDWAVSSSSIHPPTRSPETCCNDRSFQISILKLTGFQVWMCGRKGRTMIGKHAICDNAILCCNHSMTCDK